MDLDFSNLNLASEMVSNHTPLLTVTIMTVRKACVFPPHWPVMLMGKYLLRYQNKYKTYKTLQGQGVP